MLAESVPSQAREDIDRRVRERTLAERKRRIWRNGLIFVAISLAMVYVALTQRDQQAVRNAVDVGQRLAAEMQNKFDLDRRLPDRVPDLGPKYRLAVGHFLPNPLYADLSRTIKPVAVLYSKTRIDLFFGKAGRVLVLFDGHQFHAEWLHEQAFQERRSTLGLGTGGG